MVIRKYTYPDEEPGDKKAQAYRGEMLGHEGILVKKGKLKSPCPGRGTANDWSPWD